MTTSRVLQVFGCAAVAMTLLAQPLAAEPQRRKKPAPAADEDQAAASPSPSPAGQQKRRRSAAAQKPGRAASPRQDVAPAKEEASPSPTPAPNQAAPGSAATSSLEPNELQNFDAQPEPVRRLLTAALELTHRNLTYAYGSVDPASGGMDCSGTIYYLLNAAGFDNVPRDASGQYSWVRRQARFYSVLSKKAENAELDELRPGDLMFWTGTYNVDRDPPVTHTMIYLGKRKSDGKRLMFGASDGRPYDGQRRNGVSVFDFKMPAARSADKTDSAAAAAPDHSPDFAGYGPVPGMAERNDEASRRPRENSDGPTVSEKKAEGKQGNSPNPR